MKRWLLLVAVPAALAFAAPAYAVPPEFDKAEGAGTFGGCNPIVGCRGPFRFTFSALQKGFGERASGFYTREFEPDPIGGGRFAGRVTCLNVLGNTAVFGGVFTEGTLFGESIVGTPFAVWVVDNGPSGSSPPDLMSLQHLAGFPESESFGFPQGFPNLCPHPFPSPSGYFPVTSGNIVVEDEAAPGLVSVG